MRSPKTTGISQDQPFMFAVFFRQLAPNSKIFAEQTKSVADNVIEEQQKQRGRGRGRPFEKCQSGNPAGRRAGRGSARPRLRNLLLDGEAQALTRKAVELALDGNTMALRMCLDRIELVM